MAASVASVASDRDASTRSYTCSMNSGPVSISRLTKTLNAPHDQNSRRLSASASRISRRPEPSCATATSGADRIGRAARTAEPAQDRLSRAHAAVVHPLAPMGIRNPCSVTRSAT